MTPCETCDVRALCDRESQFAGERMCTSVTLGPSEPKRLGAAQVVVGAVVWGLCIAAFLVGIVFVWDITTP